ncbi:TIGR02921 family PEP-CTERM protein [Oscillatoria salina]|uniref:TIGR02921 family PEP-CTERM protein n=1 Tax=Oscillatoria salina TaxID=331517 RepID=UPI0013B755D4|nr:TIGR02921 family PEP-CTERM protein [Oscillatoria salina]MBZ8181017.1 TIGR02921 family PEP-CTERM protein [Oscillatoria salina IIICB1]NET88138.1 TIGR02921 family PEP-CTERM protein [Kamptonema sp. SIO1D9]
MKTILNIFFQSIFWLWNLTFLSIVYIGILPWIAVPLLQATLAGEVEAEFFFSAIALIAIPTICTILGLARFRNRPPELMRLFYGVEAPLFVLCLLRLFVFRELTAASSLILGCAIASIAAFLFELLQGYDERRLLINWLQAAAQTIMILVGIYAGTILLFYAVPAAGFWLQAFFKFYWLESLWWSLTNYPFETAFWTLIGTILFGLSCTLFVGMPSALVSLYFHSGQRILRAFARQYGKMRTVQVSGAVVSCLLVLLVAFNQQPQLEAFQLLEKPAATDKSRVTLLAKSDIIRKGLTNAYLSPYRYLSPVAKNNHIKVMYQNVFDLPEELADSLQNSYNFVLSPFLYQGDNKDTDKAEKLYAEFFDTSIQKGERNAVRHALQSTAIIDEAKAGVLNIEERRVWLREQEVNLEEHGDWANIEIHEVYENKTDDVEEIFYYFSLPESAVITGVWLGDTPSRDLRFPFQVSPRGAAQKVYNSQVRRSRPVDPALLEQVGPLQYRLRAFPVPPKLATWETGDRPTEMHLWLTYQVMRQDNTWQLPKLAERRNIFWTKRTKRIRNAKEIKGFADNWLEASLPATEKEKLQSHHINLVNSYQVTAEPLTDSDYELPSGKRFAIILDTSRSMRTTSEKLKQTWRWLDKHGYTDSKFSNNDADLYLTASAGKEPQRIDDLRKFNPRNLTFYGTIQEREMLGQFVQLQGETAYDGVILLTDSGSYELAEKSADVPKISAPLWLVHFDSLAPAYEDAILKEIQDSGGGVATELTDVLQRIATKTARGENVVSVVDNYAWAVEKSDSVVSSDKGLEPIAARQLILALSKETTGEELTQLDAMHDLAKRYEIVTPYSSMIVLVNDEQREALREAEASEDRFDRAVEDGKEDLNKPNNPLAVTSVPEPGTIWGLMAIALLLLMTRKRLVA